MLGNLMNDSNYREFAVSSVEYSTETHCILVSNPDGMTLEAYEEFVDISGAIYLVEHCMQDHDFEDAALVRIGSPAEKYLLDLGYVPIADDIDYIETTTDQPYNMLKCKEKITLKQVEDETQTLRDVEHGTIPLNVIETPSTRESGF